jgi:arabinosaccharide transport system substrate-binding protein
MDRDTLQRRALWHQSMNRRAFLHRAGTAAAAGAAMATGAGALAGQTPAVEAAESKATTTLTLWEFVENREHWLKSLIPGFRKLYPGADIKIVTLPYQTMYPKLYTALLSGTGAPDLVEIEIGAMGQFLRGGTVPFIPLNSYLGSKKSELIPSAAYDPWTYKGTIYAVGNEFNPVLMYYRWDLFKKAGIDATAIKTWNDFVTAGKEFKAKTGAYMIALPVNQSNYWYFIARQRGGGYFDEKGNVIVNNEIGVSSLQFLVDLVYKHKIAMLDPGLTPFPPNAAYFTALTNGAFGVAIGAPWYQGFMKDNAPKGAGKWEMTPYPKWDTHSTQSIINGGTGLAMTNQISDKDLGWKWIDYVMLRPQSQLQAFTLENLYPDMKSLYGSKMLDKPDPYFHHEVPAKYILQVADSVRGWVQNPYQTIMGDAWMRLLVPVMQGHMSAKKGLDEIAATVKKAMKGQA